MVRIGYLDEIVPADALGERVDALAASARRQRPACARRS